MSVLPAGQSLSRFLGDLEDLLHDPSAYLSGQPLKIGPRQMYGLAFLFGLAGGAFLASFALAHDDGERLALGVGLLCGASVWLGWSLMMRGHSLVLHADGVEVKYRDTTVWCPWCVFNVDGNAFVPDGDSPRVGLTLPVVPECVPFIELRREDTPIAHGAQVKGRQWNFIDAGTVVLPARYEVMSGELGELLLLLGRRLGRHRPRGAPPPEAYPTQQLDELPATPDAGGWITVHLTRLTFPPHCCDCGDRTSRTMNFPISSRWDTLSTIVIAASQPLEVPVPVCESCQQRIRDRQHRGGIRGMQVGALLFTALAMLPAWSQGWREISLLLVAALTAVAVGGLAGFLVGTLVSRRLPVALGRYSPRYGTLALRFRNPQYGGRMLAAMRSRDSLSR
jgi:hypothetical protein